MCGGGRTLPEDITVSPLRALFGRRGRRISIRCLLEWPGLSAVMKSRHDIKQSWDHTGSDGEMMQSYVLQYVLRKCCGRFLPFLTATLLSPTGGVCHRGHLEGVLRAALQVAGDAHQPLPGPHKAAGRQLPRHPRHRRLRDLRREWPPGGAGDHHLGRGGDPGDRTVTGSSLTTAPSRRGVHAICPNGSTDRIGRIVVGGGSSYNRVEWAGASAGTGPSSAVLASHCRWC